jgi:DNA-binding transcriptional ArsR family regulator
VPTTAKSTTVDQTKQLKALAHPTRVRIVAMLSERRASPVELSERLGETLGTVAYHVRTLRNLGVIKLVSTRQRRGAIEHIYEAVTPMRFSDEAWNSVSPIGKQRQVGAQLQQAGEYAAGSAAAGGFDRPDAVLERTSLQLDDKGWKALVKAATRWTDEVERIKAEAGERLAGDGAGATGVGVVTLVFEAQPLSDRPPAPRADTTRRRASS